MITKKGWTKPYHGYTYFDTEWYWCIVETDSYGVSATIKKKHQDTTYHRYMVVSFTDPGEECRFHGPDALQEAKNWCEEKIGYKGETR